MIRQFNSSTDSVPASGEVMRSRWYSLRVLSAGLGATVAWDNPKQAILAYPGAVYTFPAERPQSGIWITGTVVLEWTDEPHEKLVSAGGATTPVRMTRVAIVFAAAPGNKQVLVDHSTPLAVLGAERHRLSLNSQGGATFAVDVYDTESDTTTTANATGKRKIASITGVTGPVTVLDIGPGLTFPVKVGGPLFLDVTIGGVVGDQLTATLESS